MTDWQHLYTQNCPPKTAINDDVNPVYRFVDNANLNKKDFEPHRVKFPNAKKFQTECIFLGTSVFTDHTMMLHLQQRFPAFAKMKIAQGRIEKSDGKISYGKNFHITWWVEASNPESNFQVIP